MIITVTGPRSVGKSTISRILAKKLGLEYVSSDKIGDEALKEHGGLDKAIKSGAVHEFIKKEGYTLILNEYKKDNFVFDLSGGSVSARKTPEASKEVRETAKKKSIVVGLLPYEDVEKSIKFLFDRERERVHFKGLSKEELMEKVDGSYRKMPPIFDGFCDVLVYTGKRKVEEIADEIVERLKKVKK